MSERGSGEGLEEGLREGEIVGESRGWTAGEGLDEGVREKGGEDIDTKLVSVRSLSQASTPIFSS